jgi:glycosyltransferase involved in cell wall biosynthesis
MDAQRFDAVDAHYFYPDGVAAARVAHRLGLPLVISARGSDINVLAAQYGFARHKMLDAARQARALVSVSTALANRMVSLGMPRDRIQVLRNGVDTRVFEPFDRSAARARLGLAEGRWLLAVGNLVALKRFHVLIDALASLAGVRLLIVGEGPLRRDLEVRAQRVAPGRVVFRDNVAQSELRFVYCACDVLGLPSAHEGWPNVILESIACGTPVVAADVGGVPEILDDGAAGAVVNSAGDWAVAVRAMLERRLEPGMVRKHALRFGWDEIVSRQCELYEEVATVQDQAHCAPAAGTTHMMTMPCG